MDDGKKSEGDTYMRKSGQKNNNLTNQFNNDLTVFEESEVDQKEVEKR